MIIDAHTHIGEVDGKNYTAEDLVASMQQAGIDTSLLITTRRIAKDNGISVEEGIAVSEKYSKIKTIGHVDFDDFNEDQLKKLQEYLTQKKIVGVKLYLGYQSFYANDTKLHPLYKFCQENNYPIVFHTGVLESNYKGLLKYSHPLTVDEVASEFPDLKIVMAHFGNPWIMDCAAVLVKNKNVYVDLSGYFTEYVTVSEKETEDFLQQVTPLKLFAGSFKKFLFGTDYPLYNQKEYLEAVQKLEMSEEEKELVFSQNAIKIFNLEN